MNFAKEIGVKDGDVVPHTQEDIKRVMKTMNEEQRRAMIYTMMISGMQLQKHNERNSSARHYGEQVGKLCVTLIMLAVTACVFASALWFVRWLLF